MRAYRGTLVLIWEHTGEHLYSQHINHNIPNYTSYWISYLENQIFLHLCNVYPILYTYVYFFYFGVSSFICWDLVSYCQKPLELFAFDALYQFLRTLQVLMAQFAASLLGLLCLPCLYTLSSLVLSIICFLDWLQSLKQFFINGSNH